MADDKRERAIMLVHSLTIMVEHANTPEGERVAAQGRIDHLCAKYKIAPPKRGRSQQEQVFDELKRQQAKTKTAQDEWERKRDAQRAKQADEEAKRKFAQERVRDINDIFEEAKARDGRTNAQRQADADAARGNQGKWNSYSKYHAVITSAQETMSSNGNPMVTINYRTHDGTNFKGWYVLNNVYGLSQLATIFRTLMGEETVEWPLEQSLLGLQGMSCTVMLSTWDKGGQTSWKVDTVMTRWS